jgi:hypothetical protein
VQITVRACENYIFEMHCLSINQNSEVGNKPIINLGEENLLGLQCIADGLYIYIYIILIYIIIRYCKPKCPVNPKIGG